MTDNFGAASDAARFDASKSESSSTLSSHAMELLNNALLDKNQVVLHGNEAIAPAANILPEATATNSSVTASNNSDWRSYHLPEHHAVVATDNKHPQPEFWVKLPEAQDNSLNARLESIDQSLHPKWNGVTWSLLPLGSMQPIASSDPGDKGIYYPVQPVVQRHGTVVGLSGELAF